MRRLTAAFAVVLCLLAGPAWAHKIKVFATVEGAEISGYAYLPGGKRIEGAEVQVLGPDGVVLGRLTTAADGTFRMTAESRMDHRLVVDLGDGHRAEFLVPAGQFSQSLPGAAAASSSGGTEPRIEKAQNSPQGPVAASIDETRLQAVVEAAVARQVNPLRADIDAWRDDVRLHDILGGLGYIAGLAGLALYLTRRRERRN